MSDHSDTRPVIFFAVKEEAAYFSGADVETVICGMGKKNAAAAAERIFARRLPRFVITSGFAGGLDETLRSGDIVGDWDLEFPLSGSFEKAGVKRITFYCADRVAITREEKKSLREETGRDAVEMESAVIRGICQGKKIPSATVRVVSDSAGEDLPLDFNRLMNADHTMSFCKLAGALCLAPWKVPELIRFSGRVKFTAKALGKALSRAVASSEAAGAD